MNENTPVSSENNTVYLADDAQCLKRAVGRLQKAVTNLDMIEYYSHTAHVSSAIGFITENIKRRPESVDLMNQSIKFIRDIHAAATMDPNQLMNEIHEELDNASAMMNKIRNNVFDRR